ncbi:DUF305 domain-containing protein [Streptomyces griseorubiginosus]|uniref:DUF305 domain-containing protein n=1 Tax=Streptomyces griseorubiginosus TaxID=67304 RepID=UPI002E81E695|nr:DUF305 domain-containing protein [Streptomyces griseorubiginosus]WUB43421.1 DUF305 domain-containing protein [Streptomyces griseorubiginosus]WUB51940.1 DUF305 domain-containing protein [Streptomyces griseorubiginosus]
MRTTRLTAVSVTVLFTLAACGGGGDSGSDSGTAASHNAQDVSFAQGMIPHHRQAVEMAELAAGRASSSEVKDLATRVEKAQGPEITTMTGWLKSWDEKVPEAMSGMDHSAHSGMAGMMDDADMGKLEKASGKDFDSMFLTMMVEHHEGAVEMATTEKAKGEYKDATDMAGDIITAQNAEISEMKKLLGEN